MKVKGFLKKQIIVLMCLFIVVTSVGCSSSKSGDTNVTNEPTATAAATVAEETASNEPVTLDLFVNLSWWPLKDWSGSIPEEITKRTGVKFNVTVATDAQQLPLMIASGNIADITYTDVETDRLANPNLCYSWNELIDKYATNFKIDPIRQVINQAPDGKFYTILDDFATAEKWKQYDKATLGGPAFSYRKDIMEKLGNPPLKTLDDLLNVFKLVKQDYPDMVPLIMDINWIPQYFSMQLGAKLPGQKATDLVEQNDGKLIYYLKQPEILEYYKFMNNLYRQKYIIAENYTFSDDKKDDEFLLKDKAFSTLYAATFADVANTQLEKSGADYRFAVLPNMLTDKAVLYADYIGWAGMFVSKTNKNPEASIKFIQFMYSDEGQKLGLWGVEGKDWNMKEDGYPTFNYNRNDMDLVNKEGNVWWGLLCNDGAINGSGYYDPNSLSTPANQANMKVTKFNPLLALVSPKPDTEEKNIKTKLTDMIKNEEVKVLLAKSEDECVQAFNSMLAKAESIGMVKYEDWANGVYAEKKSSLESLLK